MTTLELISNQQRLNMIRDYTEDNYEEQLEEVLSNILLNGSEPLKLMLNFFSLIDTPKSKLSQSQPSYSIGDRKISIIKTSKELEGAMKRINPIPFIGFDSEQRPTFKKGERSHGISLIQLANETDCYLIHTKLIKDIHPLKLLLEDESIVKIGTGLRGDKQELYNQFNIKLKSTIDLEEMLKKLSSKDGIGAKRAASIFLNQNLQKSKRISRSNWETKELSDSQIKYATEDATIVYDVMNQILREYPFVISTLPSFFNAKVYKPYLSSLDILP